MARQTANGNSERAAKAISLARVNLITDYPWYGALALKLQVQERPDIPTMATDGTHLFYNADFTMSLSDRERYAVVAHEVLHCAFLHMFRMSGRDLTRWNIATDYVINLELKQNGFVLPKGVLLDEKWKGQSAEYVYANLPSNIAEQLSGQGNGQGKGNGGNGGWNIGGFEPPPPPGQSGKGKGQGKGQTGGQDPSNSGGQGKGQGQGQADGEGDGDGDGGQGQGMSESDWRIAVTQATKVCEGAGRMPASVARLVEEIFEPRVDWRAVLKRFVSATVPADYSFAHPNRRFMGRGILLPGTVKEGMGEIVFAVDTSGSITDEMLAQVQAEGREIIGECKPEKTYVVYCDAEVNETAEFEPFGEEFTLHGCGGGGTRFQPVFDWVREQGIQPKCLVYLTDLECSDRPEDPGYPVLWVVPDWQKDVFPWGETIRMMKGGDGAGD